MSVKNHKTTSVKPWLLAIAATLAFFSLALVGAAPNASALSGLTMGEISTHNSSNDCWLMIGGKAYNMTGYITPVNQHPGGAAIIPFCGKNATAAFAGQPMHAYAISLLPTYYIGDVAADTPAPEPDTTPPTVTIISPANNTYAAATIELNYTTADNVNGSGVNLSACTYKLDTGAIIPLPGCANKTLSALSNGIHNITVFSKDIAGNAGNSSISFAVSVNATPPVPPPQNITNTTRCGDELNSTHDGKDVEDNELGDIDDENETVPGNGAVNHKEGNSDKDINEPEKGQNRSNNHGKVKNLHNDRFAEEKDRSTHREE